MKKKAGRPEHQPTKATRHKVEMLAGYGMKQIHICWILGITVPTLEKHYAEELVKAGPVQEAKLIGNLIKLAGGDGPTALKATLFALQAKFGWTVYAPKPKDPVPQDAPAPAAQPALGKKEQAAVEAQDAEQGTSWADLIDPDESRVN